MKLENINRLDEALELNREYLIIEGILSDLVATGITKFQTWVAGHDKVVEQLGMLNYVNAAKELDVSLLDDSPEAEKWWKSAADAINKKHGGKATPRERAELIVKARAKIGPMINRDLEDTEARMAELYAKRTGNNEADTDKLFAQLFSGASPRPRKRRKTRREYAMEGIGQHISTALDMLDPKKRVHKGVQLIRASNNARIATTAISMLSHNIDVINVDRKLRSSNKNQATKTVKEKKPLQFKRVYELAMFINKCMAESSKSNKDEKYWARKVRDYAKKLGIRLKIENLPRRPYPEDFEEFKQKYAPKPVLKPGEKV
jgi:hypothetical protein